MSTARRRGVVWTCAGALVACMGWSAPGWAQRAREPATKATLQRLHKDGYSAAQQGRWEQAHRLLARAWSIEQRWQIASTLGWTEVELGRYRDAAAHLSFFLRETRELAEVGAAERANAERLLARARAHVGTLIIVVEPAGADVLIDGVVVGRAPLVDPVFVSPGWRSVDVRRDGYRATGEAREVVSGGTARFELHMAPVADSGPPAVPSAAPTADAVPPPVSNTAAIAAVPSMATSTPLPQARGWRGVDTGVVIGGTLATAALSGLGVWFGSKVSANIDEQKHCAGGNDQCDFTRAGTPAGKFGRLQEDLAGQKQVRSWLFGGAALVAAGTLTYAIVMPRLSQPAKVTATAGPGGVSTTFVMTW